MVMGWATPATARTTGPRGVLLALVACISHGAPLRGDPFGGSWDMSPMEWGDTMSSSTGLHERVHQNSVELSGAAPVGVTAEDVRASAKGNTLTVKIARTGKGESNTEVASFHSMTAHDIVIRVNRLKQSPHHAPSKLTKFVSQ